MMYVVIYTISPMSSRLFACDIITVLFLDPSDCTRAGESHCFAFRLILLRAWINSPFHCSRSPRCEPTS